MTGTATSELLRAAMEAHRRGDLARAEHLYAEVIEENPRQAEALHYLGMVLHQRGSSEEGIRLLEQAVTLEPSDYRCWNTLGNVLKESGRVLEAIKAYREGLRLEPSHVNALFNLGVSLHEAGETEEAIDTFRRAIAHAPHDAELWNRLGGSLKLARRLDEALPAFEQAVALAPELPEAHHRLGLARLDRGDLEEAVARFRRALELAPDMLEPRLELARAARHTGDDERALLEALESGHLGEEERATLHFALGQIYDRSGAYDAAFSHYAEGNAIMGRRRKFNADKHARLVDELVETFSPAFFDRAPSAGAGTLAPVFIVGMPRSGTTVVEQILASHPEVHGGGELPYVTDLVQGLRVSGVGYPECVSDLSAEDLRRLADEYVDHLGEDARRAARITDKMTTNYLHLGFISRLFPEARVVHCVRDARDVCLSNFFQRFGRGQHFSYRIEDFVLYYRDYRRLMAHWAHVLPVATHVVRYEDLVSDQESETRALIAHCGLDWDPRCLSFHDSPRSVQTASNWQVRQPIYRDSAGRWKNYARHLRPLTDALAGDGYD